MNASGNFHRTESKITNILSKNPRRDPRGLLKIIVRVKTCILEELPEGLWRDFKNIIIRVKTSVLEDSLEGTRGKPRRAFKNMIIRVNMTNV